MTLEEEKCSYADKYKAIRPPKCGCKACRLKWEERLSQIERVDESLDKKKPWK